MQYHLAEAESRFADLIWANEPLSSGALVQLCAAAFDWKKSTTYTMLRRLCERGLFVNDGGTVRAALSREAFDARRSRELVQAEFGGSLPRFLAAFSSGETLSADEVDALRRLIDNFDGGQR